MHTTNSDKTPEALVAELTLVTSASTATLTALGISKAQTDAADAALSTTNAAIHAKKTAMAQVTAAAEAKRAGKALAVASLNDMIKTAQESTASDGLLASVGFPPRRSGTPRPALPQTVTGVTAVPQPDGAIRLAWKRSGNSVRAVYQIEAGDGTSWTMVGSTSRIKLTLGGIQPGLATWFRITSVNAGNASAPSIPVAVYAPASAEPVRLKLAA